MFVLPKGRLLMRNISLTSSNRSCVQNHSCQMAIAGFLESYVFCPSGFWTMDQLRCAAKFDPFVSLDCAGVEGVGAQSNFAFWQHCPKLQQRTYVSEIDASHVTLSSNPYHCHPTMELLQVCSFIVTPLGRANSVTVSKCHSIRNKEIQIETQKLSLY